MIILLILFALILFLVERYYLQNGLSRIYYDVSVSQALLEPEEEFIIRSTIENHKPLFLPYLSMEESLPYEIQISETEQVDRDSTGLQVFTNTTSAQYEQIRNAYLKSSFYLMPNQKFTREVRASLPCRGRFLFRGCNLHGGDFLGLSDSDRSFPTTREVVVMPKRAPIPDIGRLVGDFLGDLSVNRFIFEDPMLTIGFSEYTGREPLRDISWSQTARMGRTMVKNYDHTVDLSLTILLNVQSANSNSDDDQAVETCISMVRSLCETLEEQHIKYSFLTNAIPVGMIGGADEIEQGNGNRHFFAMMEMLGRLTSIGAKPFSNTILRACRTSEQGRHHILVTPDWNPEWAEPMRLLEKLSDGHILTLTPEQAGLNGSDGSSAEEVSA